MSDVTREPFLTLQECESITTLLMAMRFAWIDRGGFWTFGGARYLDSALEYQTHIAMYNDLLRELFDTLYHRIEERFPYAEYHENACVPGFHIFGSATNGVEPSVHKDLSYRDIEWGAHPDELGEHLSFTICLQLPKAGGGLKTFPTGNVWFPELYEYHVGMLYLHTGDTTHQICNDRDIGEDEYRITLQGHLAKVGERWFFYF